MMWDTWEQKVLQRLEDAADRFAIWREVVLHKILGQYLP